MERAWYWHFRVKAVQAHFALGSLPKPKIPQEQLLRFEKEVNGYRDLTNFANIKEHQYNPWPETSWNHLKWRGYWTMLPLSVLNAIAAPIYNELHTTKNEALFDVRAAMAASNPHSLFEPIENLKTAFGHTIGQRTPVSTR